jgi:hypothetical protein
LFVFNIQNSSYGDENKLASSAPSLKRRKEALEMSQFGCMGSLKRESIVRVYAVLMVFNKKK